DNAATAVDDKLGAPGGHGGVDVQPREVDPRPATLTLWNAAASGVGAWGRGGATKPTAGTRIRDAGAGVGAGSGAGGFALGVADGGRRHWEGFGREPV
ncbi:unnamed protein product, partial [Scytosiphon promiscuus]